MVDGLTLSQEGIRLTKGPKINYSDTDCQAFMELIFQNCGVKISYAGSNDMYRNACSWVGTLSDAKRLGCLVPGAALFIVENDGKEPEKYRADGKGNASHVGMYVGSNALTDVDKNGKSRVCDVVHSSASMERVAGSTLKNAWTHVGLWKNVEFGVEVVGSVTVGAGNSNVAEEIEVIENTRSEEFMANEMNAYVCTENGEGVNFRTKTSSKSALVPRMPKIPEGAVVQVLGYTGEWSKIIYMGYTGYVMTQFLKEKIDGDTTVEDKAEADETILSTATEADPSLGDVEERAKRYRVYVDFTKRADAIAFQKAMQSCQVGSVK